MRSLSWSRLRSAPRARHPIRRHAPSALRVWAIDFVQSGLPENDEGDNLSIAALFRFRPADIVSDRVGQAQGKSGGYYVVAHVIGPCQVRNVVCAHATRFLAMRSTM